MSGALARYHGGSGALVFGIGPWVVKAGRSQTGRRKLCHESLYLKSLRHTLAEDLYIDSIGPRLLNRLGILITHRVEGFQAREGILSTNKSPDLDLVAAAGAQLAEASMATRKKVDSRSAAEWASKLAHARAIKAGTIFGTEVRIGAAKLFGQIEHLKSLPILQTPYIADIHGDAHLGNLILSQGGFKWIDPRGYFIDSPSFDPAYDVGKIAHEPGLVQGMYGDRRAPLKLEVYSRKLLTAYIEPWRSVDPNIGQRACFFAAVNLLSATTFGQIDSTMGAQNMLRIAARFLANIDTPRGIEGVEWFE